MPLVIYIANQLKQEVDVLVLLGRDLNVLVASLLGPVLSLPLCHRPLLLFVPYHDHRDIASAVIVRFSHPHIKCVEGPLLRQVKHQQKHVRIFVKFVANLDEFRLPAEVPKVELVTQNLTETLAVGCTCLKSTAIVD